MIKAAGAGGVVMDFGGHTGNPVCDRFNWILGQHADPVQAAVATDQRRLFDKALMGFAKSGVQPDQGGGSSEGIDPGWNRQLNEPLDQQVAALVKAEGLGNQQHGSVPGATGAFNKSQMQLGGETLVGQSETDAAVIEMMKSMQDAAGADDGEFVIDATEG